MADMMRPGMYRTITLYADGRPGPSTNDDPSLESSMQYALFLADRVGCYPYSTEEERPSVIQLWYEGEIVISIAVFIGGLLSEGLPPSGAGA